MKRIAVIVSTVVVCLSLTAEAAPPQGEVVIRTRDGQNKLGRVLSETSTGYLLAGPDGTEVVPFTAIVDIRQLAPAANTVSAAPAPVAQPMPAAQPAPQPVDVATYYPPNTPPPAYPPQPPAQQWAPTAPPMQVSALAVDEWMEHRKGFHFGLGITGQVLPAGVGYANAALQFNFDWTFGRTGLRVAPQVGFYKSWSSWFVAGVDTTFQVNVAEHYAFGVGLQVGVAAGPYTRLYFAPTLAPAIVKLGDRGQHQLQLTVSVPVLQVGSFCNAYYGGCSTDDFGYPMGGIGYAYLF